MKNYYYFLLSLCFVFPVVLIAQEVNVIPKPKSMTVSGGTLELGSGSRIMYGDNSLQASAEALSDHINRVAGVPLAVASGSAGGGDIGLTIKSSLAEEEYNLIVGTNVIIEGKDLYGVMRGGATLLQLIQADRKIPKVVIADKPDPNFRGISLDVARKYHTMDEIRAMIDVCFFYKIAHAGLRLSDDQSFMFPSTAFPKLDNTNVHGKPAYPKAECEALEAYAKARGVYIYVEIEVPGHSLKLRENHPEVFGELSGYAGNIDITSSTCKNGVKTLIDEICEVFSSSPYFHLGCDEAGGVTHSSFSTFYNEMNAHIASKGRKTIIWEASYNNPGNMDKDNTLVIAWEFLYYPPKKLLADGFSVLNGGWDPLYLVDHYPWEQYTINSQERIYDFDKFNFQQLITSSNAGPVSTSSDVPGALMSWWEGKGKNMVPFCRHAVPPFSCAMWNRSGEDNFDDFEKRYPTVNAAMEKTLFPASMTSFDLINDYFKPSQQFSSSSIQVSMSAVPDGDIRYTKDGTPPLTSSTKYSNPITVNSDLLIMSALFKDGEQIGNINRILFQKVPQDRTNLTYGKPVTSNKPYFYTLPPRAAVDGAIEINSYWSAYTPPAEWNSNKAWITIDLERTYSLDKITVFAGKPRDDVYEEYYKVDISTDNSSWTSVANNVTNTAGTNGVEHSFSAKDARYIRLTSTGNNMFPEGHYSRIIEIRASGSNTKKPALVAYNGRTLLEKKPPLRCYRLSGANSYKVMYADNKGFTNAVTKDMTDTVYTPDSDLNTGMWYWKASSNLDFDNYSAVDSFIVETMTSVGPSVQTAKSHVTFLNTQKGVRIFIDGFKGGNAVLNIFDLKGRLITALKSSDIHSGVMFWDHRNKQGSWVGSGIYILRLTVNNSVYMHRIVLNR